MNKYHYVEAVLSFIVITMAIFLYLGYFSGRPVVTEYYYLWDKTKDLLLVFGFSLFLKGKRRLCCYILSAFFFARVVWQLFEVENYAAANQKYLIDLLFALDALAFFAVLFISKKSITLNLKSSAGGV